MNDRRSFLLNIQDFILNTKPAKYYTRAPPTLSDEKVSFTADGGWNIRRMGGKRIGREMDGKVLCRARVGPPSSEFAATETNFHLNESGLSVGGAVGAREQIQTEWQADEMESSGRQGELVS